MSQPGMLIVCGDSHTSTHGALGALAFGIGSTEVAHVLATQALWQRKPLAMRIPQRSASGASESNSSSGRGARAQNWCTASSRWRGLVIGVPLRASRISIQGHRAVISAGSLEATTYPARPKSSRRCAIAS